MDSAHACFRLMLAALRRDGFDLPADDAECADLIIRAVDDYIPALAECHNSGRDVTDAQSVSTAMHMIRNDIKDSRA